MITQEKHEKILIVEDNPDVRESICRCLESKLENIDVASENDVDGAIESYQSDKPKVIILDALLPHETGFYVAKMINKKTKDEEPYIIFLSGLDSQKNIDLAKSYGANEYVTKPFDSNKLVELVKSYLEK
jgi:two-component system, OmpR family, response regulator VicR